MLITSVCGVCAPALILRGLVLVLHAWPSPPLLAKNPLVPSKNDREHVLVRSG